MTKPNINDIKLNEPTILDGAKVMDMRQEFLSTFCKFNGTCNLDLYEDYIEWLAYTLNQTHQTEFNNELGASKNTYLVMVDTTLIGMVEIIFYYNYSTNQRHAHIIECIRPSCRRKGYGKPLLKKVMQECHSFGIKNDNITYERNSKASNGTMTKILDF